MHKMTTISPKLSKLSFWVKIVVILSVAHLVRQVIFFSAWDKSRAKWANSQKPTKWTYIKGKIARHSADQTNETQPFKAKKAKDEFQNWYFFSSLKKRLCRSLQTWLIRIKKINNWKQLNRVNVSTIDNQSPFVIFQQKLNIKK